MTGVLFVARLHLALKCTVTLANTMNPPPPTASVTDTPRTDAVEAKWRDVRTDPFIVVYHARQLERELAAAHQLIRRLTAQDQSWNLESILKAFVIAETKLRERGYDGDGWEALQTASRAAEGLLAVLALTPGAAPEKVSL